jgi:SCO1/SenC
MKTSLFVTFMLLCAYSQNKISNRLPGQPLTATNGRLVSLADFKGKVIVLDFWFTGCINCMIFFRGELSAAEQHFAADSTIVFISVCVDKKRDTWLNSLEKGNYASKESVNLYTNGMGDQHPVVRAFHIVSYPQPIVLDRMARVISRGDSLTRRDNLTEVIEAALIAKDTWRKNLSRH